MLISPVEYYLAEGFKITSEYGMRFHPILKENKFHYGIDFGGKPRGYPVRTPFDGKVHGTGFSTSFGNWVTVKSNKTGKLFLFAHLQDIWVKRGQEIRRGIAVGGLGTTGLSTAVHLHFELRNDNFSGIGVSASINPHVYKEELTGGGTSVMITTHIVKIGETLAKIAAQYPELNVTWQEIAELNRIVSPYTVYPGQVLKIKEEVVVDPLPPTLREPYSYEISGLKFLVDAGYIQPNSHLPAEPATKGWVGTVLSRLKFDASVNVKK